MIELYNVTKRYPGGQIGLLDVSLKIERGEMAFLTGPSGAGKTTFLKLIYREEVSTEGVILVNGRNVSSLPAAKVPYLRRTIGVVFQNFRLIPRKTVFENVSYLPRILGLDVRSQKKLAFETLRRVGLAHRINAFPMQLSGGEQQRVAIARALINQPEILLADEPTGNLDPDLSEEILKLLLEINSQGTTVIFATHDRDIIAKVGRRVMTLESGRLVDDKNPEGATSRAEELPLVEDEFTARGAGLALGPLAPVAASFAASGPDAAAEVAEAAAIGPDEEKETAEALREGSAEGSPEGSPEGSAEGSPEGSPEGLAAAEPETASEAGEGAK